MSFHEHQLWCCEWLEQIQVAIFSSFSVPEPASLLTKRQILYFKAVCQVQHVQILGWFFHGKKDGNKAKNETNGNLPLSIL